MFNVWDQKPYWIVFIIFSTFSNILHKSLTLSHTVFLLNIVPIILFHVLQLYFLRLMHSNPICTCLQSKQIYLKLLISLVILKTEFMFQNLKNDS